MCKKGLSAYGDAILARVVSKCWDFTHGNTVLVRAVSKTRGFAHEIYLPCVKQAISHTGCYLENGNIASIISCLMFKSLCICLFEVLY